MSKYEPDQIKCSNGFHPKGTWHTASPMAASWEWGLRIRQWLNRKRWGCICNE